MDKMVKHSRIVCSAKCVLNIDGFDYHGVIENISLSGALIKLDNMVSHKLSSGDKCHMMLCSNLDSYPVKYTSKVVRYDSEVIGIEFLELNIL